MYECKYMHMCRYIYVYACVCRVTIIMYIKLFSRHNKRKNNKTNTGIQQGDPKNKEIKKYNLISDKTTIIWYNSKKIHT